MRTYLITFFLYLFITSIHAQFPGGIYLDEGLQHVSMQVDRINAQLQSIGHTAQKLGNKKQLDSMLRQVVDQSTLQLEDQVLLTFNYNADGQMTLHEESWLNPVNGWRVRLRIENAYNGLGELSETKVSRIDNGVFTLVERFEYVINNNLVDEVIYSEYLNGWELKTKTYFTYDNQGATTEQLVHEYINSQWEPARKLNHYYTSTDKPDKIDYFFWNNGQWNQNFFREWTYDSQDREVLELFKYNANVFINKLETSYNGNVTTTEYSEDHSGSWYLYYFLRHHVSADSLTHWVDNIHPNYATLDQRDFYYYDSINNLIGTDSYTYDMYPTYTTRKQATMHYNDTVPFNNLVLPDDHLGYMLWEFSDYTFRHQRLLDSVFLNTFVDNFLGVHTYSWSDVSITTNNEAVSPTSLMIYPNPASELLTLELPGLEPATIEFYNSIGQLVKAADIVDNRVVVSDLAVGWHVYVVRQGDLMYGGEVVIR